MLLIASTPVCVRHLLCNSCSVRQFRSFAQMFERLPSKPVTCSRRVLPEARCVALSSASLYVDIRSIPRRGFRYKIHGGEPQYKVDQVDESFKLIYTNGRIRMLTYLPLVYICILLSVVIPELYLMLYESKVKIGSTEEFIRQYAIYGCILYILSGIAVFFMTKRFALRMYHHEEKNAYVAIVKEYYYVTGHIPFKQSDITPLQGTSSRWKGTTAIFGYPLYVAQNDFVNLSYSNRFLYGIETSADGSDTDPSSADSAIDKGADKTETQTTKDTQNKNAGNINAEVTKRKWKRRQANQN